MEDFLLKSFRNRAGIGRICETCTQICYPAIVFQYMSDLHDYYLEMPVPVQVHRRDLCKQKRPEMLVQVQDSDLYKHPFSRVICPPELELHLHLHRKMVGERGRIGGEDF